VSYSAPLKRFWFVIVLGALLGALLGVVSAYRVDFATIPPKLTAREQPTYTAGTQLEVSSALEPYYRSAVDVPVIVPGQATNPDEEEAAPDEPLTVSDEPDVTTLVVAANYYPYVIEGDAVKALRERLFGKLEGEVQATAIGATITPSRQEPGRLPFIQLVATSDTPQHAIALANQTAEAFIRYVKVQQDRRKIRPAQRLIIKQIKRPERTFAVGGTSLSLPVLIFVALTMVAVAIAFLLNRIFPRPVVAGAVDDDVLRAGRGGGPRVAASGRRDA
jgi:hypothetical protein